DGEVVAGIPQMALVPIPGKPMPPMPTATFKGFPFYMAGQAGHRPPQAPFGRELNGGLPRHRILSGQAVTGPAAIDPAMLADPVTQRVLSMNNDPNLLGFAKKLTSVKLEILPEDGTTAEKQAIKFHAGQLPGAVPIVTAYGWQGMGYPSF